MGRKIINHSCLRYSPALCESLGVNSNEWISQIQGKETTQLCNNVIDMILLEIKKQKITNMADLNGKKLKEILKKLRMNKYYEHIPHILNKLNGLPIPHFEPELEEKLRTMFKMIQAPFLRHAPTDRKNFLSYSYVLHKMCQLLGKDEYLQNFSLEDFRGQKSCAMDACGYSIHMKPLWRPRNIVIACLQLVRNLPL